MTLILIGLVMIIMCIMGYIIDKKASKVKYYKEKADDLKRQADNYKNLYEERDREYWETLERALHWENKYNAEQNGGISDYKMD